MKGVISIIGKIFKSSFLTNLFGDTNIICIFCKLSQTYNSETGNDGTGVKGPLVPGASSARD